MANALYAKAKEAFLGADLDLLNVTLKTALVKNTYSVDLVNHEFLSDVGTANIAATSFALEQIKIDDGVFDAENETIENYGTSGFAYLIIYQDSGLSSTSRLIAYIDTADGLPVNSTNETISITIQWSDLATKIFSL
jgi:hypothetical protein